MCNTVDIKMLFLLFQHYTNDPHLPLFCCGEYRVISDRLKQMTLLLGAWQLCWGWCQTEHGSCAGVGARQNMAAVLRLVPDRT